MRGRPQRGFTLIELMIVVAIIGLLASIAIPGFRTILLKSKRSERDVLMTRLANDVKDYVGRKGGCPGTGEWSPGFNPPYAEPIQPQRWNASLAEWKELDFQPEGNLRYRYSVYCKSEASGAALFYVQAIGDLDGDGITAAKLQYYRLNATLWSSDAPAFAAGGGAWEAVEKAY